MTSGWVEIADGSWYRRYDPWDVNVGVVRGSDGLCVVDTRGSHRQAAQLVEDLRIFGGPLRAAINTHWHFDHTWGNAAFAEVGADLWGHVSVPATMAKWFEEVRESLTFADSSMCDELAEVVCTPPSHLVDPVDVIDLGDRGVEVRFLGAGHTDGDVIATCGSAVFAGDLVEQAGPPAYGNDSHPLEWPDTLSRLVERLEPDSAVVPGHGIAVDASFCRAQHATVSDVAEVFAELHARGVPRKDALSAGRGRWPIDEERLGEALLRAYDALDRP